MKNKRSILKELIKVVRYERSPHAFIIKVNMTFAITQISLAVIGANCREMLVASTPIAIIILAFLCREIERKNRYNSLIKGYLRGMKMLMHMAMKAKEAKEQEGGVP